MSRDSAVVRLLARKFMLSKSSDAFVSLIAWVSVAGVALGVLALTVVTSVINGFEGELQRVITGMNGDLVLYSRAEPFSDLGRVEARVKQIVPEVQHGIGDVCRGDHGKGSLWDQTSMGR